MSAPASVGCPGRHEMRPERDAAADALRETRRQWCDRHMRSDLFDAKHMQVQSQERWAHQSDRMIRVGLGPDVLAAKGAMVAYQGQLTFAHERSGDLGRMVRRMVSADDAPLMRVSGQGLCWFARNAATVFTLQLEGDAISIGGAHLLAFDAALRWDLKRVQGGVGALASQGLFNTVIEGAGTVAITSLGAPMVMDDSQAPVFVDPNAAIGWSANLVPEMVSSMNLRSMVFGGTGEAFQLKFHGPGFVIVQPAETVGFGAGA